MSEFEDIAHAWATQMGNGATSSGPNFFSTPEPLPIPDDAFSIYIDPNPAMPAPIYSIDPGTSGMEPGTIVDDSNFEARVITAARPVLVLFSLPSCGSCYDMKKPGGCWQQALAYYADRYDMYEYVCDTYSQEDKHYDVHVHPTVIAFKNGEDVGVYEGAGRFEYFKDRIDSLNL